MILGWLGNCKKLLLCTVDAACSHKNDVASVLRALGPMPRLMFTTDFKAGIESIKASFIQLQARAWRVAVINVVRFCQLFTVPTPTF